MLTRIHLTAVVVMALEVFRCATPAHAQQSPPTPGSPGATTSIDGKQLPPRYVVWGEGTTDEMCLGLLLVTRP